MDTRLLERNFLQGPIVDIDGYPYFVTSLSDGIPRIDSALLIEVLDNIQEVSELDCDVILAPEAMGIPLATGLSLRVGIPFLVIRKRPYGLPGEIGIRRNTGYSESAMYAETLEKGERVTIVDDVIDTGGTLRALVNGLREAGIVVTEIVTIYNRNPDIDKLSVDLGVPIRWLLAVGTEDGRPVIRGHPTIDT